MSKDAGGLFEAEAQLTVDGLLERQPEEATKLGAHLHDVRLTIGTAPWYAEASRWAAERLAALAAIDTDGLAPEDQADAAILKSYLERRRFEWGELREQEWDATLANPGLAIALLLARDFAPLPERLRSLQARLADVPESLAAARSILGSMPEVHIRAAIGQFTGTRNFFSSEIGGLTSTAAVGQGFPEAVRAAVKAVDEHLSWLKQQLDDGKRDGFRDPRIAPELYKQKLQLLLDTDLTPDDLLARAEAELAEVTEQMAEAARRLLGRRSNGEDAVAQALGALTADPTDPDTILESATKTFSVLQQAVADLELVTDYGEPVNIIEMPEHERGDVIAYCEPPGPIETVALPTVIAVMPPPESWSANEIRSFYETNNVHLLHDLLAHEGMPGHALQGQHSRRFHGSTPARALAWSLPFAEGWGVYAEHLMVTHGYPGEGNPDAVQLQWLLSVLRGITNAILDVRMHYLRDLTEQTAVGLLTGPGHQQQVDAELKWRRVQRTSAKLSTYFAGFSEIRDLAADLQGAHPDWRERQVHDAILAHGTPPVRHLRALLGLGAGLAAPVISPNPRSCQRPHAPIGFVTADAGRLGERTGVDPSACRARTTSP